MSCQNFTSTNPACKTFTIIEPDSTLLTAVSSGGKDASLDESGSTIIPSGQPRVQVTFSTPKASTGYQFEYLYIDALGLPNPGDVEPVVVSKSIYGFVVDFAGLPLSDGYILRWRVVVIDLSSLGGAPPPVIDAPESLYLNLPIGIRLFLANFVNPRSATNYGFTELRIENLVTPPSTQRIIVPQIVTKTMDGFSVGLSAPPDDENYFLVARVP